MKAQVDCKYSVGSVVKLGGKKVFRRNQAITIGLKDGLEKVRD